MVEQNNQRTQDNRHLSEEDYRETLIQAGRKLREFELNLQEKTQILIVFSDALFPQITSDLKKEAIVGNFGYEESAKSVFGTLKLFIVFSNLVSELAVITDHPDIVRQKKKVVSVKFNYQNTWPEPPNRGRIGESARRLKIVLTEHATTYPNVPVNYATLGQAIGGITKQAVFPIFKRLEKANQIPEGIKKQPSGNQSPKNSATHKESCQ